MTSPEPVLLLKTQSGPNDAYLELFSQPHHGRSFAPRFVPVLRHHFRDAELDNVRRLLRQRKISRRKDAEYGGMIFTSQRAVEAFASVVGEATSPHPPSARDTAEQPPPPPGGSEPGWPHLSDVPFYSVGPATTRALANVPSDPPLKVYGSHTGVGDVLAPYILDHYADEYPDRVPKPPLLFLVGETRRDIIPRTLMSPDVPIERRINVKEEVVYGTGVMESFHGDFAQILKDTEQSAKRWVVVFSPTGCDDMLRALGMLDENGRVDPSRRDGATLVITIGPTTQRFLKEQFGFAPDTSADKPSPEGVLEAILQYRAQST